MIDKRLVEDRRAHAQLGIRSTDQRGQRRHEPEWSASAAAHQIRIAGRLIRFFPLRPRHVHGHRPRRRVAQTLVVLRVPHDADDFVRDGARFPRRSIRALSDRRDVATDDGTLTEQTPRHTLIDDRDLWNRVQESGSGGKTGVRCGSCHTPEYGYFGVNVTAAFC